MKKAFLIFAFIPFLGIGQMKNKNVVYFEVLGKGFLYSFNYERYVYEKNALKIGLRGGLSYFGLNAEQYDSFYVPYGAQFLFGKYKGHFEISAGQTFYFESTNRNSAIGLRNSISFGYKRIPISRTGITFSPFVMLFLPPIEFSEKNQAVGFLTSFSGTSTLPFLGFQIGYMF